MLQIDHVYEFFYTSLFENFDLFHLKDGVPSTDQLKVTDISVFTPGIHTTKKIFFYDQEPLLSTTTDNYFDFFTWVDQLTVEELQELNSNNNLPYGFPQVSQAHIDFHLADLNRLYKKKIIATSEISPAVNQYVRKYNSSQLYYFFHGFAALDWYRGFYALNYNKQVNQEYKYDYVSFNRLVNGDRAYRCYFVSQLIANGLLEQGQVSFGLVNEQGTWQEEVNNLETKLSELAISYCRDYLPNSPLIIDNEHIQGTASADIPRCVNDSFWHIVTETVFYYDKLHLTEKIFKPIVMKQPFMLLAAPGNLAYLKSYGFKTFEGIIDESYDLIQDPDQRTEALVAQLAWYCSLSADAKADIIKKVEPIVEYNFQHFYSTFKHTITKELITNCQSLFKEIGYDDSAVAYDDIYKVLTN